MNRGKKNTGRKRLADGMVAEICSGRPIDRMADVSETAVKVKLGSRLTRWFVALFIGARSHQLLNLLFRLRLAAKI